AGFSSKDADDLFISRIMIETSAVDQMQFPIDSKITEVIYSLIKMMKDGNLSKERFDYLDFKLHYLLLKLAGNKSLIKLWLSINELVKTIMEITNERSIMSKDLIIQQHNDILEAIMNGDRVKLKRALEDH